MGRLGLMLALALCVSSIPLDAQAAVVPRLKAGEKLCIAAIGTSLTAGSTWFTRTGAWLAAEYPGQVSVHNEGVGASASKYSATYTKQGSGLDVQLPKALAHSPDAIFIEFAVNDAYVPYGISTKMSKDNLQAMIDQINAWATAHGKKVDIVVQTMNNVIGQSATARPNLATYYQGYRDVAAANGVLLVDHHANWVALYDRQPDHATWNSYVPDGIHTNDLAAQNVIVPEIRRVLNAQAVEKPAAIQVGSEKQLFIDELFFAAKQGVSLAVNQPVKDARPVIVADKDKPWELNRIASGTSVVDDGGEVKVYYDAVAACSNTDRSRWRCYAVSKDGVHFEKPKLGIVPFDGRTDTNIVWPLKREPSYEPGNVFLDTNPKCLPEERYKMVCGSLANARGTSMAVSADGLHWNAYDKPSFPRADTTVAAYFDDRIGRYVGWVRRLGDKNVRMVARCEFDDPRDWGPDTVVFAADEEDNRYLDRSLFRVGDLNDGMDYYCGGVNVYRPAAGVYFGVPPAYYHFHREVAKRRGRGATRSPDNDGPVEAQLITSRDSIHWYRPQRGKPFIPLGPEGSWDCGSTYVAGGSNFVYRGDEVWIYYTAQPFTHGDYASTEKEALGSVMRAVARLDGFVSVDAGFQPGRFTTPPIVFAGRQLVLNVDTGGGGWLRVELQDESGKPIAGHELADCDAVNGNYIRRTVSWKGRTDLSGLAGKPVRMRVETRSTKLFAFQFAP